MSRLITIKHASHITRLSVTTLRRRVAAGTLPAMRTNTSGGKLLFDEVALLKALKREIWSNMREAEEAPTYTCTALIKGFGDDEEPKLSDANFFKKMEALGLKSTNKEEVNPE